MNKTKKKGFNRAQSKATANIFLKITETILLAMFVGILFPKISGKIELREILLGITVVSITYLMGIIILRNIKDI